VVQSNSYAANSLTTFDVVSVPATASAASTVSQPSNAASVVDHALASLPDSHVQSNGFGHADTVVLLSREAQSEVQTKAELIDFAFAAPKKSDADESSVVSDTSDSAEAFDEMFAELGEEELVFGLNG
jgi:hypothetical protein